MAWMASEGDLLQGYLQSNGTGYFYNAKGPARFVRHNAIAGYCEIGAVGCGH